MKRFYWHVYINTISFYFSIMKTIGGAYYQILCKKRLEWIFWSFHK